MSDKSQALIDELVSACIAFGRQVEPDWQTRIEDARVKLCEYMAELEAGIHNETVPEKFDENVAEPPEAEVTKGQGLPKNFPPVMGSGDGLGWY